MPSFLPRFARLLQVVACSVFIFGLCGCNEKSSTPVQGDALCEAWQSYRLGEFDRAEELFRQVSSRTEKNNPDYAESLMGQASIWNTRQDHRDPKRAAKLYAEVEELDPKGPMAPWAAMDRVRIRHLARADEPLNYQDLAQSYRDVYSKYPQTSAGKESLFQAWALEEIGADSAKATSLLAEYDQFLEHDPASVYQERIQAGRARLLGTLSRPQEKLTALVAALKSKEYDKLDPNEQLLWNYWAIASTAEFDAGDFAVAREYYQKLIDEYPSDLLVFRCNQALKRMNRVEADLRAGRKISDNLSENEISPAQKL